MKKATDLVLCFDLGGTKLRAALIDQRGRILRSEVAGVDQSGGFKGLLKLFKHLEQIVGIKPYKMISVASAGPLHPAKGVLLDPTNFFTNEKSWGVVPLVRDLKKLFKKPVILENDAAAAVLGEYWLGGFIRTKNLLAMTLGTGVGIGIVTDGEVLRAGRGLHTEASHIPINAEDKSHACGCGAFGCIEAYLGGTHFARRLSLRRGQSVSGHQAVTLAEAGDLKALAEFKKYGYYLALAVRSLCVTFAPEVVVFSGGFSHAHRFFLPEAKRLLPGLMSRYREGIDLLPELRVSKLQNDAGVLGAAYRAYNTD